MSSIFSSPFNPQDPSENPKTVEDQKEEIWKGKIMGSVKYYFGGTKTQQPALILLLHEAFKEEGGGELREPREREPDKIFF